MKDLFIVERDAQKKPCENNWSKYEILGDFDEALRHMRDGDKLYKVEASALKYLGKRLWVLSSDE